MKGWLEFNVLFSTNTVISETNTWKVWNESWFNSYHKSSDRSRAAIEHIGATWRIRLNLCFLRPMQVHNRKWQIDRFSSFCIAHGRMSSGTLAPPGECDWNYARWRHLVHRVELALSTAHPSPQPKRHHDRFSCFRTVDHRVFLYLGAIRAEARAGERAEIFLFK